MPSKNNMMPTNDAELHARLQCYEQARNRLIAAAVEDVLEHCSDQDRVRLNLIPDAGSQGSDVPIPEFNEKTDQYVDLIVQQAIATISILICKQFDITVLKPEA